MSLGKRLRSIMVLDDIGSELFELGNTLTPATPICQSKSVLIPMQTRTAQSPMVKRARL